MSAAQTGGGDALAPLANMVYPGRVIIVGRTIHSHHNAIIYALTGRSPSSQARRIVAERDEPGRFRTVHTDPEAMSGGNPALLYYDCIRRAWDDVFVVSNGAQTDLIAQRAQASSELRSPFGDLAAAMTEAHIVDGYREGEQIDLTLYEPDQPHYTPRISALLHRDMAALHICRRAAVDDAYDGESAADRLLTSVPLLPGQGWLMTTYAGPSEAGQPLPSFAGAPMPVDLEGDDARSLASAVHAALAPAAGAADLRVATIALTIDPKSPSSEGYDSHIINRHEEL